jgi:hypothetical protein
MFELVEIDTFVGGHEVIAEGSNLEGMRKYAMERYCNNDDPEYDKEIYVNNNEMIYKYENRGGQYQGSGYKPHGYIRHKKNILVIE